MPKVLTIAGLVVSGLVVLIFGLDLAIGMPWGGLSKTMDVLFVAAGAILAYISWTAFREQP
jgi:predicted transporter